MNDYGQLAALIVDPNPGMRANLQNMLNQSGLTRVEHAAGAGAAIRLLKNRQFDVVICEYDLGEGQDGQQLLEDLRHNQVIDLHTIYFIVTGERAQGKVVSAAELGPTDYILKPFTADMLSERIARAVDKRAVFRPVHQLIAQSRLREAIEACARGEAIQPRHASDFMRLRAELHMALGEAQQAEALYRALIDTRAVAWARLGLAKALHRQERLEETAAILQTLVDENASFMDAWDWLARTHEQLGQIREAQAALERAVAISPHAVRRLRKLGDVALVAGDAALAGKAFHQVVGKSRYSEFRDPEDHVRLARTLIAAGDAQQAESVIRDLRKSFDGHPKMPACRALSTALLRESQGDATQAAEELRTAAAACREPVGMSADMKVMLAQTCLLSRLEDEAGAVMLDVMNNAANGADMARAMGAFAQLGRADLAEKTAQESRRQVVALVTGGADKARQGDYKGAVEMMLTAARKLPDNPQVVFNAAVAILKYLDNLGWDGQLGEHCRRLIERARLLEPANQRLAPLAELLQQIRQRNSQE